MRKEDKNSIIEQIAATVKEYAHHPYNNQKLHAHILHPMKGYLSISTLVPSLTESDLQICCFIKLGIANPGIADLLGIESTSVSKRKLRLKERITQKIGAFGKGQTLDLWLWEF